MTVESAPFINGLDAANPGGGAPASESDDHHRLIKAALKATLPNLTGAVTATQAELNCTVGGTGAFQGQLNAINTAITGFAPLLSPVFAAEGGTEGGQINLAKPVTGSTLAADVAIDISGDKFRVFEGGGASRGFMVDLSTCLAGAATTFAPTLNPNFAGTLTAVAINAVSVNLNGSQLVVSTSSTNAVIDAQTVSNGLFLKAPVQIVESIGGVTKVATDASTHAITTTNFSFAGTSFYATVGAGAFTVDAGTTAVQGTLRVRNIGTLGASLLLQGNGASTPSKTIRVLNGIFEIVNDAYSATILSLTEAGTMQVAALTTTSVTAAGALIGATASVSGAVSAGSVSTPTLFATASSIGVSTAITVAQTVTTVGGTFSLTDNHSTVIVTAPCTITLPTAVGRAGRRYTIKRTFSGSVLVIATVSVQTIDGASGAALSTQYAAITIESDGSNWQILGQYLS